MRPERAKELRGNYYFRFARPPFLFGRFPQAAQVVGRRLGGGADGSEVGTGGEDGGEGGGAVGAGGEGGEDVGVGGGGEEGDTASRGGGGAGGGGGSGAAGPVGAGGAGSEPDVKSIVGEAGGRVLKELTWLLQRNS